MGQGVITLVIGADTSSTVLAGNVAGLLNVSHAKMIKRREGEKRWQEWHPDNRRLVDGDVVLHVEELITTSLSALEVREGIKKRFPDVSYSFAPILLTGIDRSDPDNRVEMVEKSRVISLLELDIRSFDSKDCPYCKASSEALEPKVDENWQRLTAE